MTYDLQEIIERLRRSHARLTSPPYLFSQIFQESGYPWPGDWEGRALLAFVSLLKTGVCPPVPCMDAMVAALPSHVNADGYFGAPFDGKVADEQQVAGHNWFLRGLIEYSLCCPEQDTFALADQLVERFYLPLRDHFAAYPATARGGGGGGVSGHAAESRDGWRLSTDTGCAFIALDGLSHYYAQTHSPAVGGLLKTMIERFMALDRVGLKMQTHATLSAARGIYAFYRDTGDARYLGYAKEVFEDYLAHGMTLAYQNFNWFGRPDSWTEPCAVVDSFLLALHLFEATREPRYQTLARRIFHNGLAFAQRGNGGAGTDVCVTAAQPCLRVAEVYEATFCCTMRLAEGLFYAHARAHLLDAANDRAAPVSRDAQGRYFCGDLLLCADRGADDLLEDYCPEFVRWADGERLFPIVKLYKSAPEAIARKLRLQVVFN